jgi:hypothetical protein
MTKKQKAFHYEIYCKRLTGSPRGVFLCMSENLTIMLNEKSIYIGDFFDEKALASQTLASAPIGVLWF